MFTEGTVKEEHQCDSSARKQPKELSDQVQVKKDAEFGHKKVEYIKEGPCSDDGAPAEVQADHKVQKLHADLYAKECTHPPDVDPTVCSWAPTDDGLIQQPVLVDTENIIDSDSVSKDSCIIHTSLNKLKQEYNGDTDRDNRASDNGSKSENTDVHITRERISEAGVTHTASYNDNCENSASDGENETKENNMINCERDIHNIVSRDCFVQLERLIEPFPNGNTRQEHTITEEYDFVEKGEAMVSEGVWSSPSVVCGAPRMRDCWVALERLQLPGAETEAGNTDGDTADSSDQHVPIQVCDHCGKSFALRSDLKKHVMIHIYSPAEMDKDDVGPHDQSRGSFVRTTLHEKVNATVQNDAEINTYVCDICGRTFEQKHNLIRHIQLHSFNITEKTSKINRNHVGKEKPYTCDLCGKKYIQKAYLAKHIQRHTTQKSYKCEICNKLYKKSTGLIIHKRTHTGERPYSCDICDKRFSYWSGLKCHKLVHSGEKPYSCQICKKSYTGSTGLRNHILTHLGALFPCEICDKMFKGADGLKQHLLIHQGAKPYSCDVCQKYFRQASNLRTHQRIHKGERPYSCEICKMAFNQSSALRTHKQTHTGERLQSCHICHSKFARADTLKRHMLIHTGEKPYSCEHCYKTFTQMGHLQAHIMHVHSTVKAYSCNICKKKFKTPSNLRQHKEGHSEVKLYYNCEICQKLFLTPGELKIHKRIHTGDKPYACDMCNYRSTQSSNLRTHKRLVHTMKPFSCQICDNQFKDEHGLEKHKRLHAESKMYSCEICTYRFSRSDLLKRHQRIHEKKSFFCKICKKPFGRLESLNRHNLIHTGDKPYTCSMCNLAFRYSDTLKQHKMKIHSVKKL